MQEIIYHQFDECWGTVVHIVTHGGHAIGRVQLIKDGCRHVIQSAAACEEFFPHCSSILGLIVSDGYRGIGYGTEILRLLEEKAKELGAKSILCFGCTPEISRILEKNGYEQFLCTKDFCKKYGCHEQYYHPLKDSIESAKQIEYEFNANNKEGITLVSPQIYIKKLAD